MNIPVVVFWMRRDLRLHDNCALYNALQSGLSVLPVFIFDTQILSDLPENDSRVGFIYNNLQHINKELTKLNSALYITKSAPLQAFAELLQTFNIKGVYTNSDYEPYAITRDNEVKDFLHKQGVYFNTYKDQVIFETNEILKSDGKPYTVYTAYMNKWMEKFSPEMCNPYIYQLNKNRFYNADFNFPGLKELGFVKSNQKVPEYNLTSEFLTNYENTRNVLAFGGTNISTYLRFGLLSVRKMIYLGIQHNKVFLKELIWREFFMQILYHFPEVITKSFKPQYDKIIWINNFSDFDRWKNGETGYPVVDAAMIELNTTGLMHNRARMITASFLCKHLLIDWRWGEAYFASKLLDFELSSNNGNWQWAAGTGCDAAPYFRIFNPLIQQQKFDPENIYLRKWLDKNYLNRIITPVIDHKYARERALTHYKKFLNQAS